MRVQACISDDDFEILTDICDTEHITISALLTTLVSDFLASTKAQNAHIISEAKKIKPGRPKEGDY
jgi:hypothetical protein